MSSLQNNLEQGRAKLAVGDYQGALAHADAALALDAISFEALQLRSRALYLLGRDADALQTLRQARIALQRPVPDAVDDDPLSLLELHDELSDQPPFEYGLDALETLLALRGRHSFDRDLLSLLAELAEDAGRFEIAREAYQELVNEVPPQLEAWEGLVHVLCHEDLEAANDAIARAQALFPTHPLFFEFLGFIHYRRREFRRSLAAYQQAIALGDTHPDNYEAMVEAHLALGDTDAALEALRTLEEMSGNDVEIHRFILEVGLQCEHFTLALDHAHQLVRLQPSHADTYCYKAWVEISSDDWPAAERTLRLGFHKAVDGAFCLFELVDLLISEGALDEALRVTDLAMTLAPDHPESYAARGKVLRETGVLPEALQAFTEAATLAPQDDAYQTWIGVICDNMGNYQEALRQYNHVLSRHPSDVWTLTNRGLTYLVMELYDRALSDFSRGLDLDPQDAQLYFWRACAHTALGSIDLAFRELRRALDLSDEIYHWIEEEPSLEPLQHDPRYHELLRRYDCEG